MRKRTMRRMKEIGLVWKRPRYILVTNDPHRAQKRGDCQTTETNARQRRALDRGRDDTPSIPSVEGLLGDARRASLCANYRAERQTSFVRYDQPANWALRFQCRGVEFPVKYDGVALEVRGLLPGHVWKLCRQGFDLSTFNQ